MAARVTERLWEIGDIVDVLEAWEAANVGASAAADESGGACPGRAGYLRSPRCRRIPARRLGRKAVPSVAPCQRRRASHRAAQSHWRALLLRRDNHARAA